MNKINQKSNDKGKRHDKTSLIQPDSQFIHLKRSHSSFTQHTQHTAYFYFTFFLSLNSALFSHLKKALDIYEKKKPTTTKTTKYSKIKSLAVIQTAMTCSSHFSSSVFCKFSRKNSARKQLEFRVLVSSMQSAATP